MLNGLNRSKQRSHKAETVHHIDVSSFLGLIITIRFVGQENSSRQTSFVIDDTSLIVQ